MELSVFIAKILGVVYVTVGLSTLFNSSFYRKLIPDLVKNRSIMFVLSFIGMPVFFIWVLKHNVWQGWPVLVTLFGWIGFFKSVVMLLFPEWFEKLSVLFLKWVNIRAWWGGFGLLIGLLFCYLGWMVA